LATLVTDRLQHVFDVKRDQQVIIENETARAGEGLFRRVVVYPLRHRGFAHVPEAELFAFPRLG
jgi:hypothetical protein